MNLKLLSALLLSPPGINLFFLILAYVVLWISPKTGRRFVAYNIILLYIMATPLFFFGLTSTVEHVEPLKHFDQKADAIVLLGGGNWQAPEYGAQAQQPSPFALQRMHYAAYIQKKTKLPIITSGGMAPHQDQSESHVFATLLQNNYHITDIIEEPRSRNTNENALFVKKIAAPRHIKTIYLVTNAFHMQRAQYIFEHYGFRVIPAPTGFFSQQYPKHFAATFVPSSAMLFQSQIMILEWMGKMAYMIAGHPY